MSQFLYGSALNILYIFAQSLITFSNLYDVFVISTALVHRNYQKYFPMTFSNRGHISVVLVSMVQNSGLLAFTL